MFKTLINKILRAITKDMDMSTERGFWLVLESVSHYRLLVVLLLILSVTVAGLEAVSVAFSASAIIVITGSYSECAASIPDYLRAYVEILCGAGDDKYQMFFILIALGIVAQILRVAMQFAATANSAELNRQVTQEYQEKVVSKLMAMKFESLSVYSVGEQGNYLRVASLAVNALTLAATDLLVNILVLLGYLSILLLLSWQISLISIGLVIIYWFVLKPLLSRMSQYSREILQFSRKLSQLSVEYLSAGRLVRLYGKQERVRGYLSESIRGSAGAQKRVAIVTALMPALQELVTILCGGLVLVVSYLLMGDEFALFLPVLLGYILILNRAVSRAGMIYAIRAKVTKAMPSIKYVADFFDHGGRNESSHGTQAIYPPLQSIRFNQVSFAYPGSTEKALNGLEFEVYPGEFLGIVGSSGAGKSTLVDLLVDLYRPTAGSISINGVTSDGADAFSWRSMFSMVSQNDLVLHDTVRNNMLFAKENATEEEIVEAAKQARAYDFICQLESGLDTKLGELGFNLSGGQLQRIAMARAILRDTPILVFDEATSALDSLTEQEIVDQLENNRDGRTIISIAHRLSTLKNADRIMVLQQGQIYEIGSHRDLLVKGGLYSAMWSAQQR
jgi:ABC-type multidrug transport system fused ATPase/permease subunit